MYLPQQGVQWFGGFSLKKIIMGFGSVEQEDEITRRFGPVDTNKETNNSYNNHKQSNEIKFSDMVAERPSLVRIQI